MDYKSEVEAIDALSASYHTIRKEISKIIVGQDDVVKSVLISIFSNGHCLLVGVPGLAKTLLVQTVANVLDLSFNRIQFTPDLMPSDIIGSEILGDDRNFKFIKGPVFSNIILADEINRTPPKTQAALLEAMQEKCVTAAGVTHALPNPFFVLATQNPIEQEGTYPLPEAQLDRFMFNVFLDYPSFEEEVNIVKNTTGNKVADLKRILTAQQIAYFQQLIRKMPVADQVLEYAVKMVAKTRPNSHYSTEAVNKYLSWGAGPRASQYLVIGAKCHAAISGKYSPDIEDVQAVAKPVLRHRIVRNYKAEAEGINTEKIISDLF
ncbi:AAA family ATPase [Pedobacter psychrophilus]|uniref:AAA family ATPase n=1 Tax=Pedobacter psychrophilus TaxID=1826909 RepID=A0A179DC84_9SPHI|nr:AAA family ATPase [Pedobacter psychrophilus]OAQ38651.1 AAA family ATPase [Pedobacter psychrophilus]